MDRLSTYVDPVVLAGDVNIRLERTADAHTVEFSELLACHGLVQHVDGATHDVGGTLDVLDDLPAPTGHVLDVGLSDDRLLRWLSPCTQSSESLHNCQPQVMAFL